MFFCSFSSRFSILFHQNDPKHQRKGTFLDLKRGFSIHGWEKRNLIGLKHFYLVEVDMAPDAFPSFCFLTALISPSKEHVPLLVGWCIFSTWDVTCRNFLASLCIYHSEAKETKASRVPINLQPNKLAQVIVILTEDTGKWKDVIVFYWKGICP